MRKNKLLIGVVIVRDVLETRDGVSCIALTHILVEAAKMRTDDLSSRAQAAAIGQFLELERIEHAIEVVARVVALRAARTMHNEYDLRDIRVLYVEWIGVIEAMRELLGRRVAGAFDRIPGRAFGRKQIT